MKSISLILLLFVAAALNVAWVAHSISIASCDPTCGTGIYHGTGVCQSDGQCLCVFGWTGPSGNKTSHYIPKGQPNASQILTTEGCTAPCANTPDYQDPACAVISQPCDQTCGTGTYYATGECQSDGQCLCYVGWTGPGGNKTSHYIANVQPNSTRFLLTSQGCTSPCDYSPVFLNPVCGAPASA
jgi:hypothetical protein